MKELQNLIKRVEGEIDKMPTGELRNLLCDANIMLQQQALNPITPEVGEFVKWISKQTELENAYFSYMLGCWIFRFVNFTTAELFDWWRLNIRK